MLSSVCVTAIATVTQGRPKLQELFGAQEMNVLDYGEFP